MLFDCKLFNKGFFLGKLLFMLFVIMNWILVLMNIIVMIFSGCILLIMGELRNIGKFENVYFVVI